MEKQQDTKRPRGRPTKDSLIKPKGENFRDMLASVGVSVGKPPAEAKDLPEYLAALLAGSLEVIINAPGMAPMAAIREIRTVAAQIERMNNLASKDRRIAYLEKALALERARNAGRPGVAMAPAVAMPADGVMPAALRGRPPKGGALT